MIQEQDNVEFEMSTMQVREGKDLMYPSSVEVLFYRICYTMKI